MEDFVRDVYLLELETQCRLVRSAAASVGDGLALETPQKTREVFRGLHSLLTHASNVSRLLWPPKPLKRGGEGAQEYSERKARIEARAVELRDLLELPESGHVLADRSLRNHLEHFDERLEEWERTSERRSLATDTIGPRDAIAGLADSDVMRWYDPATETFYFRHESFDIREIVKAADQLLVGAITSLSDPRLVATKLASEFPDRAFTWEDMKLEVVRRVFGDGRLDASTIASLQFARQRQAVDVDLGGTPPFEVPLGEVSIPGPRAQAVEIADKIVAAVLDQAHGRGS